MKSNTRSVAAEWLATLRSSSRKLAITTLVTVALVACGSDGADGGDDDEGKATNNTSGSPSTMVEQPGTTLILSCIDTQGTCNEYRSDAKNRATIEMAETTPCTRFNGTITKEPCTLENSVATCTRRGVQGDALYSGKTVYYPPITLAGAKLNCGTGKFEETGG